MKPQYVTRLINQLMLGGGERILDTVVEDELAKHFKVLRPGDVEWLSPREWKPSTIVALDGNRVRLVMLEAKAQKTGAFRRLIDCIIEMEMVPVVVEPHDRLALTLASWGWRHRRHGIGDRAETVWYPRP
jgi:hypothetical protein